MELSKFYQEFSGITIIIIAPENLPKERTKPTKNQEKHMNNLEKMRKTTKNPETPRKINYYYLILANYSCPRVLEISRNSSF